MYNNYFNKIYPSPLWKYAIDRDEMKKYFNMKKKY